MRPLATVTQRGITFNWTFADTLLYVELAAPTFGWVAVGFNDREGLTGTNLIMGAVLPDDTVVIEDRYIVRPGLHQAKTELGADDRLRYPDGSRGFGSTTIRFAIPTQATDAYSHTLVRGQSIHLLLAYSADTDFAHHSRVREHTVARL